MMFDALMQESMLHQMLHVCVASDNNSVFLMLHKFKPFVRQNIISDALRDCHNVNG